MVAGKSPRAWVAVAALLIGIGALTWALVEDDAAQTGSTTPAQHSRAESRDGKTLEVVDASELLRALAGVGYPVYWAGLREGVEYEVTRLPGQTFIRYLPRGEEPDTSRPYLTVGSYEREDAVRSVERLEGERGELTFRLPGGGVTFADSPAATNAYLAYPGVGTQVEVYDPQPGRALQLIRSGRIDPVG